jgi:hypothetical protein
MHRYTFALNKPFIDAASRDEALKEAIKTNALVIKESEIPKPKILVCSVTPKPSASGMFSASARLTHEDGNVEVIATADAPSKDRAIRALGYENPDAHTCRVYKQRFGTLWELHLSAEAKEAMK